jgi:SPP1 gp7 family putative phage head morphogenesis protein
VPNETQPLTKQRPLTRAEVRRIRRLERERFNHAQKVEQKYGRQLRGVAEQIGRIIRGFAPEGDVKDEPGLRATLSRYADLLFPWANAVSESLIAEISRRDETAWIKMGNDMGRNLRSELKRAPTGDLVRALMAEQVSLITSLPLKAAQRVHELSIESLVSGKRSEEIAKEIMRSGQVTRSRATLIARTESARASSVLTQARATHFGSTHYKWHSQSDSDVRPLHRQLNGRVFAWDDPPVIGDDGETGNPGTIYNCRCWSEPIFPD